MQTTSFALHRVQFVFVAARAARESASSLNSNGLIGAHKWLLKWSCEKYEFSIFLSSISELTIRLTLRKLERQMKRNRQLPLIRFNFHEFSTRVKAELALSKASGQNSTGSQLGSKPSRWLIRASRVSSVMLIYANFELRKDRRSHATPTPGSSSGSESGSGAGSREG